MVCNTPRFHQGTYQGINFLCKHKGNKQMIHYRWSKFWARLITILLWVPKVTPSANLSQMLLWQPHLNHNQCTTSSCRNIITRWGSNWFFRRNYLKIGFWLILKSKNSRIECVSMTLGSEIWMLSCLNPNKILIEMKDLWCKFVGNLKLQRQAKEDKDVVLS